MSSSPRPHEASGDLIEDQLGLLDNDDLNVEADDSDVGNPEDEGGEYTQPLHSADRSRSSSPLSSAPSSPRPLTRQAKLDAQTKLGDGSDSELSDLPEDIDNDEEEEEEKVVIQPKAQAKSKSRSKKKGKGRSNKKQTPDHVSDSEGEEQPQQKGKKRLVAKAAYWDDLPAWEQGSKSPLMEMPAEVMDNVFGFRPELGVREYVALAGTCKYFRHYLDDKVFHEIFIAQRAWAQDGVWRNPEPDLGVKTARAPFTRDVPDWRRARPLKVNYTGKIGRLRAQEKDDGPGHYIPRGHRSTWTREQYTVYKEEKRFYRQEDWKKRKPELRGIAKENLESDRTRATFFKHQGKYRTVLGTVPGVDDGEAPIDKNERGLPVDPKYLSPRLASEMDVDKKPTADEIRVAAPTNDAAAEPAASTAPNSTPDHGSDDQQQSARGTGEKRKSSDRAEREDVIAPPNKRAKKPTKVPWPIPDESDEEQDANDEYAYLAKHGWTKVHDFWPSKWRQDAAVSVNYQKLAKTHAIERFKLTEAQLLTLKHFLVPNTMGGKQPVQLYFTAAVEALAYRAHGGEKGHQAFVQAKQQQRFERLQKREAKESAALADGTYVHKKKARPGPHWWFCCPPDREACYCDECWNGRCECETVFRRFCSGCGIFHS